MKKLLFCTMMIILMTGIPSPTAEKHADTLYQIEEELYGINYADQATDKRIARLEQSVYGIVSKNKNINERIKRLSTDLSADVLDEKITPTEDTFAQEEVAEDSSVKYPALDKIETKLFKQINSNSGLNARIVKIEKHLFNQTYDKEDYYTRVERIKNNVFKDDYRLASEGFMQNEGYYDNFNNSFNSDELSGLNKNLFDMAPSKFAGRLAELENQILGGSYELDSDEERLNRLNGAYKAQKSIKKYDSNRFQQGLSTAMQVGAMLLMMLCMVL